MKKFGYIKKDEIFICGTLVAQTYKTPLSEKEVYCKGNNNSMFVYDLDNLILIKKDDYYINLECVNSYLELERIRKCNDYNHTYFKNKALSKEILKKIVEQNDEEIDGRFFIVKESLIPYNDNYAINYGIPVKEKSNFISFRLLKKLHNRCIKRRDGLNCLNSYEYVKTR